MRQRPQPTPALLEGTVLVVVGAGRTRGKRFVFDLTAAAGADVVAIDEPGAWASSLESSGVVARFLPVPELARPDDDATVAAVVAALSVLGRKIDGVLTFAEHNVSAEHIARALERVTCRVTDAPSRPARVSLQALLVARVAKALGLPLAQPECVAAARDKRATRAACAAAGLPTPRFFGIAQEADAPTAAARVGFPAVLKPAHGSGSDGVVRVDSLSELRARHEQMVAHGARIMLVAARCA